MKKEAYRQLVDTLLNKRVELYRRVSDILESTGTRLSPDFSDQAIELENAEVLDELSREAIEELAKINMAIDRVNSGTYGTCMQCGTRIAEGRLRAVPWAAHCIECAERNESRVLR